MMLYYSKTMNIEYFLDPPPPKKKGSGYDRSRYVNTLKCLSISAARDLHMHLVASEQIE